MLPSQDARVGLLDDMDSEKPTSPPKSHKVDENYPVNEFTWALSWVGTRLMAFLLILAPSFLRSSTPGSSPSKLHPTAYLDGLRGTAAFIVFIHHSTIDWFPVLSSGYGSADPARTSYVLQMPVVRILYSGRGMVAIFFVISGYVLSYKALRLMRAAQYAALLDSLASSTFRRSLRLQLPILVSTFLSFLLCRCGLYLQDPLRRNVIPQKTGTFNEQLHDWWTHILVTSWPFQAVDGRALYSPPYDGHLWTIPIEFYGSMVVFGTLLCMAKLRTAVRGLFVAGMVWYTLWMGRWDLFLFLSGTLLCEIQFSCLAWAESSDNTHSSRFSSQSHGIRISRAIMARLPTVDKEQRSYVVHMLCMACFLLSLFILSFPDENAFTSPGYVAMISYTPAHYVALGLINRYWLAIGAFLCVISINFSPALQAVFNHRIAQYLGKISFALYIVHGPILYTLGMKMLYPAWSGRHEEIQIGGPDAGSTNYMISFLVAFTVNTVVCVSAADLFWRQIDARSVMFAGWLMRKCWRKETDSNIPR